MASKDETSATQSEVTKINLQHRLTVNAVSYGPGHNVEVPRAQADDLLRMDADHTKYLLGLQEKHVYEQDAGTMAVGGSGS